MSTIWEVLPAADGPGWVVRWRDRRNPSNQFIRLSWSAESAIKTWNLQEEAARAATDQAQMGWDSDGSYNDVHIQHSNSLTEVIYIPTEHERLENVQRSTREQEF